MDDDTLTQGMRGLVANCVREAAKRGTNVVGAEHVLLALAADAATPTAALLADAGLRYDAIDSALRAERLLSLAAAGVTPVDASLLTAAPRTVKPAWGRSPRPGHGNIAGRRASAEGILPSTECSSASCERRSAPCRAPCRSRASIETPSSSAWRGCDRIGRHASSAPECPLPVGGSRQGLPRRPLSNAS